MNRVVEIPKELTSKGELVVITRKEYEGFLNRLEKDDQDASLWRKASVKSFLSAYSKVDAIYDEI